MQKNKERRGEDKFRLPVGVSTLAHGMASLPTMLPESAGALLPGCVGMRPVALRTCLFGVDLTCIDQDKPASARGRAH